MTIHDHLATWFDDALLMLTLRLEHEVALTRLLRGDGRQEGFLGLFVSDEEAQAIIGELAGTRSVSGAALNDAQVNALWSQVSTTRLSDQNGIWARYAAALALTESEQDLLLLAMAPALDPRFGRVYGYLNDDLSKRYLTPALARTLLDRHALSVQDIRAMLAPAGPLRAYGLINLEGASLDASALQVPDDVLNEILAGAPSEAKVFDVAPTHPVTAMGPCAFANDPVFWGAQRHTRILMHRLRPDGGRVRPVLRAAALHDAHPVILGADALTGEAIPRLVEQARGHTMTLETTQADLWAERGLVCTVPRVSLPTMDDRLRAIAPTLAKHPADLNAMLERLRGSGKLDITTVLTLLDRHAHTLALNDAVTARLDGTLDAMATRINTAFTRGDLILPRATSQALDTVIAWRTHAPNVLDDWGFAATFGKSRALTALFKGPSGTGKTMAASVIANTLGLPLYKVDLATLVSKYIGETEKNLDALFTAAEAADVVLFFDECDAIFGKRSEVSDAHDRYANLETAYLLQRMEQFAGIMVLASNLQGNMDDAFLRRIDLVAEFPAPGPRERLALWQRLRLTQAPLGDDIDFQFLAETFDLTGGEIRNCCIDAAHAAARSSGTITMAGLIKAVAREQVKQGRTLHRASFGVWEDAL